MGRWERRNRAKRPFCDGLIRPCTNQAKRLLFGTTRSGQARGEPRGSAYKGALRMWLTLSVCDRQGLAALVFSLALIHPSSWRDCLESSRRVLDRLCLVLQEGENVPSRPVLATRYTPNRGLLGLSRQSLEGKFSEVRSQKAEKASGHTSEVPPVALALELVVILVVRRPPGNGSPLRSQHITAARWVGRIEHQALIRWPCAFVFLELREVELTPRQRDAISHMTVWISKMWVSLEGYVHQTPGDKGTLSLVLKAHLERQKS